MPEDKVTREDVIAAAQPFVAKGVKSPDELLLDRQNEEAQRLWRLHDEWIGLESQRIKDLPIDEAVRASIALNTIWYDAGFTGTDILDEISSEWLISALDLADGARRRDLADVVNAKIREIQEKIKEQDPTYEIWDPGSMTLSDWNPPRNAAPGEFYADYAYFIGPEKATIDEAVSEYLRFHPDADTLAIKAEMERAAAEYTEN